jgi:hypothetical protein
MMFGGSNPSIIFSSCFVRIRFFFVHEKGNTDTLLFSLGDVHIIRNAMFQLFRQPSPFVTKNRTNPYALTMVRNKSLTPLERYVRNLWTSPNRVF